MAKPKPSPIADSLPTPANDFTPRKRKRETKEERDLREWHHRCQELIRERAPWLRDHEYEMLDSQTRYDKPPTENREKYASFIAYDTELLSGIDGISIRDLITSVAAIKPLLSSIEEEDRVTELERLRPTQLPRREAEWLLKLAQKYTM